MANGFSSLSDRVKQIASQEIKYFGNSGHIEQCPYWAQVPYALFSSIFRNYSNVHNTLIMG